MSKFFLDVTKCGSLKDVKSAAGRLYFLLDSLSPFDAAAVKSRQEELNTDASAVLAALDACCVQDTPTTLSRVIGGNVLGLPPVVENEPTRKARELMNAR